MSEPAAAESPPGESFAEQLAALPRGGVRQATAEHRVEVGARESDVIDARAVTGSGTPLHIDLKTCPDCAEDVRSAARKCRFCGYRFDAEIEPPAVAAEQRPAVAIPAAPPPSRRRLWPRWRKMTWVLLIWTAVFAAWIFFAVRDNNAHSHAYCVAHQTAGLSIADCETASNVGTGIGVVLIAFLWFVGFIVLSLVWFMSRPRRA